MLYKLLVTLACCVTSFGQEEAPVLAPDEEEPVLPPDQEEPVLPPDEEEPVLPPEDDPPEPVQPDVITIDELTYAGTGCPSNSVASSINNDRTTFTLIFDNYVAVMEPGGTIADTRKNCQINVGLRVPAGWSYSIATVDYRGYMSLEEGTYASQGTLYYFSGKQQQTDRLTTRWDGPDERDYTISDTFPIDTIVWSECGAPANLNIKSDIRVAGDKSKTSFVTTDSIDGSVSHIYGLKFQQCSENGNEVEADDDGVL